MDNAGHAGFSVTALAILDHMPFDSACRANYESLSGGLMWPDECPPSGSPEFAAIAPGGAYRYLIAYRASITLGKERTEFRPVWEQILEGAPNWPGLHPERRGKLARRRLLAAKRREVICLAELEKHLLASVSENAE